MLTADSRLTATSRAAVTLALGGLALLAAAAASVWLHPLVAPFGCGESSDPAAFIPRVIASLVAIAATFGFRVVSGDNPERALGTHLTIVVLGSCVFLLALAWELVIAGSAVERSWYPCTASWPRIALALFWSTPVLALVLDAALGVLFASSRWWRRVPIVSCLALVALTLSVLSML